MAPNPLTFAELDAYCARRHIDLTTWEGDVLMRLDDAVMTAWVNGRQNPEPTMEGATGNIPVTDVPRVKAMLKATAARTRLIDEAKAQARKQRRSK